MPFTPKEWKNTPSTTTPIDSVSLEDLETRVTKFGEEGFTERLLKSGNLKEITSAGESRANIHVPSLTPVIAVSTSNLSPLSGLPVIDGVTLEAEQEILLTKQTEEKNNGVWTVVGTGKAFTRPTEFAEGLVVKGARSCAVVKGTVYAHSEWLLANGEAVTVGTTNQTWELLQAKEVVTTGNIESRLPSSVVSASHKVEPGSPRILAIGSSLASLTSGTGLTALGTEALNADTSGEANTAIGALALSSNVAESQNTAVGFAALHEATNGKENTAIGAYAMQKAVGSSNQGNVAIGNGALYFNEGASNTAIGRYNLHFNTTGHDNIAVGREAMEQNTVGYLNTAIGHQCLENNIAGHNNVALGYDTLFQNTEGNYNLAIGNEALKELGNVAAWSIKEWKVGEYVTSGGKTYKCIKVCSGAAESETPAESGATYWTNEAPNNSLAIGVGALATLKYGAENTAIGYNALHASITGSGNVAIGYEALAVSLVNEAVAVGAKALAKNTSGSKNIAIGHAALYEVTSGAENVAVGHEAGRTSGGNGNVFLGNKAGKTANGSNELYIANNETTPWIRGQESGKKLGFYGVAPVARAATPTGTEAEKLAALLKACKEIGITE